MANRALIRTDRTLVASMSPISFGTILKGWRGSKGLDYIVVGINRRTKEISAIKHNCINQDGTIHKATRKVRVFGYTETASGSFGIVRGITSVLGQKETIDIGAVSTFINEKIQGHNIGDFQSISLHTQPLVDRRKGSIYK